MKGEDKFEKGIEASDILNHSVCSNEMMKHKLRTEIPNGRLCVYSPRLTALLPTPLR